MGKIFINFNIVSTSDCLLVIREKDEPLSEVYRSDLLETPHTQRNLTVDDLNPVMHIVQLWTTSDGTTLDSLLGSCDIDASINNDLAFGYIQIVVDRGNGAPEYDPAAGDTQYANTDLDGKDYLVYKEGFGPLKWGVDIQTITGGGFEYINGGEFSSGEGYTIQYSNIGSTTTSSSGKSFPEDIVEITGNTTFGTTHYNKLLEVNSASASVLTITISSLDAIPNGTLFGINTHNGNQKGVTLQLNSGRYCWINTTINGPQQRNAVYIGRGEAVTFMKKGSALRIVSGSEPFARVGQRIFCDGLAPVNALPESGGWYSFVDYPRFVNWYLSDLPSGELGTGTQDVTPNAANKTKFIIGSTKFWMPDTRGLTVRATSADATVDTGGPRLSGSSQLDQVGQITYNGTVMQKSGTSNRHVVLANINDVNLGTQQVIINNGQENRVKNVASNFYRII